MNYTIILASVVLSCIVINIIYTLHGKIACKRHEKEWTEILEEYRRKRIIKFDEQLLDYEWESVKKYYGEEWKNIEQTLRNQCITHNFFIRGTGISFQKNEELDEMYTEYLKKIEFKYIPKKIPQVSKEKY